MKPKYNLRRDIENLIPYLVVIAIGIATFYLIQVCVSLM
jgi:hypothetical protein